MQTAQATVSQEAAGCGAVQHLDESEIQSNKRRSACDLGVLHPKMQQTTGSTPQHMTANAAHQMATKHRQCNTGQHISSRDLTWVHSTANAVKHRK